MSISYPYKAWMLNKEWNVHDPYVTKSKNIVTSNDWYTDFSGSTEDWYSSNNVIYMDNDNTTTGIPLYYSTNENRGQLYLHPYESEVEPCTSSTTYTSKWTTKSGSCTAKTPYTNSSYFTPASRTYPSAGQGIGTNNYTWFCGWGTQKTGASLEIVSPSIHSFTSSNWPSNFSINEGDNSSYTTNTAAYYGYQKISGSIPLYSSGTTLLSSLNDVTITSATVALQKIVCKFTPSTRNLQFGTTVTWNYDSSWTTSLETETVTDLSDIYTVYYADKWSGALSVSVSVSNGVQFVTTARTFVETMSSQTSYVGDVYAVFIVPVSATVNYTYKEKVTTTSTTSSVANNAASYIEIGETPINLKSQQHLLGLDNQDPRYGYVIRKSAIFPSLTLTATVPSSLGATKISIVGNSFDFSNGGSNTSAACGNTTTSSQTLYPTTNGLGQVLSYYGGVGSIVDNEESFTPSQSSANYVISNSTSYSYSYPGFYYIKTGTVNFSLLYDGATVKSFNRTMPFLYEWIMYKANSNKAVALNDASFSVSRSSLSYNNDKSVYVQRYNSSGSLVQTYSIYTSSTSINMSQGDYLTISGMDSTSYSGPSTSVSQSATIVIKAADNGGSSVKNKSSWDPGYATLTSSVTTKVHSAKVYISASINSNSMERVYILSNGTEYSNTGSAVYYDPTVTKLRTYTKSYSGWSVQNCYRTVLSYYDTYWHSVKSSYRYFGGSSSSSSTTGSGYLSDVSATVSWGDNYGATYYVECGYEASTIKAPIIKTCTDAGSWKRYITIYNPNDVTLEFFYTSNKTSSKTGANSEWTDGGSLSSGATSSTCSVADQSGFSDEWIIAGFRLASNYYICTTIDEDVTSGTPNVVNDNWYYTK